MANTLASTLISQLRLLLQDVIAEAYRWPDEELAGHLSAAQLDLIRRRPDAYIDNSGSQPSAYPLTAPEHFTDPATAMNVHAVWNATLIEYALALALSKDAEGGGAAEATRHFAAYEAMSKR